METPVHSALLPQAECASKGSERAKSSVHKSRISWLMAFSLVPLQKAKWPGAVVQPRTRCSTRNARPTRMANKWKRCASAPTSCATCHQFWHRPAAYFWWSLVQLYVFLIAMVISSAIHFLHLTLPETKGKIPCKKRTFLAVYVVNWHFLRYPHRF